MPELPEVEVLVRHLAPLLKGMTIRSVAVHREKVIRPDTPRSLAGRLKGSRFLGVERRAKFLIFRLRKPTGKGGRELSLLGHLGMTGRMYLQPARAPLPRHAAVSLDLGRIRFIYEDVRYFGRLTTNLSSLEKLGPEPLGDAFTVELFAEQLKRSSQAIKVRIMDQAVVVGVGNIYASEALFRAGISPRKAARRLTRNEVGRLHAAIREVLQQAINCGSTIPLDFAGTGTRDGLFYYGSAAGESAYHREKLCVYDRGDEPCGACGAGIRRIVQAARSTYFCPGCQRG
ncbi:MAG TPA: formamidopyrimidine-DNA glycosylase [Verrucomicrobiales bacterium]|nr:formamidopyrimidine-DNA glycosylase [Verrucomicrobiales bacterium]